MKGRNELSDADVLQEGDAIWFDGKWKPVRSEYIGTRVGLVGMLYPSGGGHRPTFGRLKKKKARGE